MEFPNESLPILAGIINNTGKAMASVMKYIYAISDGEFYNINVKDVFRLALMDVTDSSRVVNLGIRTDSRELAEIFGSTEFARVKNIIAYSLAVRIPFLKKQIEDIPFREKQYRMLFDLVLNDADNFGDVVFENFDDNNKLIKSRGVIPSFNSEWFRRYIYTYMPNLGEITNKNLYFLGCVEAMFPLYYSAYLAHIKRVIFLLKKD